MECKNSALCIFDKPGVLTDIQRSYTVDYYPINTLTSDAPIEFVIPGSSEDYIDVGNTNLYVSFKIVHDDGTDIDQKTEIVAINNLGIATLFSDASLKIGDTQVQGGSSDYPYRAYFQTVMQFTPAAQRSQMTAMGWYKDDASKFDDKTNTGFLKRKDLVGDSQTVELIGPLYFDFFNQDRHLISSTSLRIKLTPSKPEFLLNALGVSKKYKVVFEKAILYVERLEMNPSVINGHAVGLKSQNAHYYINHTELLTYTIPKGQKSYTKDHLFNDLSPKMIMVAMIDNEAFNGALTKNPFHFKHYDLNKFALFRDGRSIPGQPLEPDFGKNLYLRSYLQTMNAFKYWMTDNTNGLKPSEWAGGYLIYAFDLTPDKEVSSSCLHAHVGNNLRLELNFEKALAKTINVLIYAITDSQIEITQLRDVITHYNR
jgi:hypothetical protein